MVQTSFRFPTREQDSYDAFKNYLLSLGIIQPSILFKSHVLAFGFNNDVNLLSLFVSQVKSSWQFNKLSSSKLRQSQYLHSILFNEIRAIEDAVKTDNLEVAV